MAQTEVPRAELGRSEAFLSYDSLPDVNVIDPQRQFKYHPTDAHYIPSATFHNGALMFGIGPSAETICEELRQKGYIGLVGIETINPRIGVNQIRGSPVVPA